MQRWQPGGEPDRPDRVFVGDDWSTDRAGNDIWTFSECDDAAVIGHRLQGKTVQQGAPARTSRGGLPLPVVKSSSPGRPPYLITTRFPTGAVSVTSIGRTSPGRFIEPAFDVTQTVDIEDVGGVRAGDADIVLGVFGYFSSLTFNFVRASNRSEPPFRSVTAHPAPCVWGQDLVGNTLAHNLTHEVNWRHGADGVSAMTIPGDVIRRVGLDSRSSDDDVSPPGLVLRLCRPEPYG